MRLGITSEWFKEEDFIHAKECGLDFLELCVNDRAEMFIASAEKLKKWIAEYNMPIVSIGRWGGMRIWADGLNLEELDLQYRLIDAVHEVGCGIYVTGCNYVKELSYYDNCTLAIQYFEKLMAYAKPYGIKIAVYDCDWDNFVCSPEAYRIIMDHLKDLYIKFDASHVMMHGRDYVREARDWGDRFAHVHIKGTIVIDGEYFDNPPAGMDMINWPMLLSILYNKGYQGDLSIEPHSQIWQGEFGEKGLKKTIAYFRNIMV